MASKWVSAMLLLELAGNSGFGFVSGGLMSPRRSVCTRLSNPHMT